ncbi:hypothetical protein H8356DRAFT_1356461 [Neocallimastix lanati (nom. inval.)]|nr:hypothetical protein H8356DRAFT_1356461 [Neocallimastix sp. JGI-2020a]
MKINYVYSYGISSASFIFNYSSNYLVYDLPDQPSVLNFQPLSSNTQIPSAAQFVLSSPPSTELIVKDNNVIFEPAPTNVL